MIRKLDDYMGPIRQGKEEAFRICAYCIDGGI